MPHKSRAAEAETVSLQAEDDGSTISEVDIDRASTGNQDVRFASFILGHAVTATGEGVAIFMNRRLSPAGSMATDFVKRASLVPDRVSDIYHRRHTASVCGAAVMRFSHAGDVTDIRVFSRTKVSK